MSLVVAVPVEEGLVNALVVAVCIVTDEGIFSVGVGDGRPVGEAEGEGDTSEVGEGTVEIAVVDARDVGKTVLDVVGEK